jgi:hypothetical protein
MTTLTFKVDSPIDRNLDNDWDKNPILWMDFLESLPGVTHVECHLTQMTINFDTEEHKNWFLLKYS